MLIQIAIWVSSSNVFILCVHVCVCMFVRACVCPGEKLKILQVLVGKLLTMTSCRDLIEDVVEEQKAARQELRELRAEQHRRTREEAAHRYTHTHTHTHTGAAHYRTELAVKPRADVHHK